MSEELYELLRKATVKVCTSKGAPKGSATFIYPRHLLTAAHVIHGAGANATVELFDGRKFKHTRVIELAPEEKPHGSNWPLPDLAVFRIDDEDFPLDHLFVELSDLLPQGPSFCASGFVRGLAGDSFVQDRAQLSFDSPRDEDGATVLQFTGNIQAGMSGGPVLEIETGTVIGIVKADRGWRSGAGGFAVAGQTIRDRLPGAWANNVGLHRKSSEWKQAVRAGRVSKVDRKEREDYLTAIRDALSQSPLLPPEVSRNDLRQPVRLRSKRFDKGSSAALGGAAINAETEPLSNLNTAFIWDPLRSPWEDVAIVAGPGMGKSWLLAYHVSAIANHQLEQLASQPELDDEVEIPVWVEAAGLARQLPQIPTRSQAMTALATATHLTSRVLDPAEIQALISSAAEKEKLVLCVDGLDEVPSDLRSRLSTALGLLEPSARQLIVTTREAAGQLLAELFPKDFEEFTIEGFTEGDVRRFIEAWHSRRPAAAARVRTAIRESHNLRPLTRVPLLLGFVCRLAGADEEAEPGAAAERELPDTRSRLYHEVALDLLSGRWRESEGRRAPGGNSDPLLRLGLLSRAVGTLVTGWRTRPEEFVWSEIDAVLRKDPDYETVRRGAISRWDRHESSRSIDREPAPAPEHVVLWEFEHDGLLVQGVSRDRRPVVRFTHLVFAELCIGMSLVGATPEERTRRLEMHRWFDDEWNDIVPIACGVAEDPKPLLAEIGQVASDPWMVQALLEGRSMAEAPDAVAPELLEQLIDRVARAMNGNMRTDLGRCLKTLEVLLSADVCDARDRVRDLVESGQMRREEDGVALSVMLCRVGDPYGVERCVAMATDGELPMAVRGQAMKALCVSDDHNLVRTAVGPVGDLSKAARESLVSALVHGDAASVDIALEIVRDDKFDLDFRASVAVGLIYAGAERAAEVLLGDPRSSRTVCARTVTALLRTGNRVPPGEAEALASDPNVVPADRLELIHALILRGDRTSLAAGAELAVDFRLDAPKRRALARTMLSTGALGRSVLAREAFADSRSAHTRVQALIALIERRDEEAAGVASEIVYSREELTWVRCALATHLLEWMPGAVAVESFAELLDLPELTEPNLLETWETMLVQMLASEMPLLVSKAERRIRIVVGAPVAAPDSGEGDPLIPPNAAAAMLCARLSGAGRKGAELLAAIVGSTDVELDTRIHSAQILAQSSSSAAETLEGLLDDESVPGPVRERLVVLFARLGVTVTFERLLALMPSSEPAYAALHILLSSAGTTEEMVERGVEAGSEAMDALAKASLPTWSLDFDELADEVPFEASSEAQRRTRKRWIAARLRGRLYKRLLSLLLPGEQEELFRVGNFLDNDATRDWLAARIPSYRDIAAAELARLRQEVLDNPSLLPSPIHEGDALDAVRMTAEVLREWVGSNMAGEWDQGFEVFLANEELFKRDFALATFEAALLIDESWPSMVAHRYMLNSLRSELGVDLVQGVIDEPAILDRLKPLVDSGKGSEALACAAVGLMRWPEDAAIAFYGAGGAEIAGQENRAESLMKISASNATVKQATEGRKTLGHWQLQHELDPERIERLRSILGEALGRDDGPGEGPSEEDQIDTVSESDAGESSDEDSSESS